MELFLGDPKSGEEKLDVPFARRVKNKMAAMVGGQSLEGGQLGWDKVIPLQDLGHSGFHVLCLQQFSGESTESCWLRFQPAVLLLWVLRKYPLALQGCCKS